VSGYGGSWAAALGGGAVATGGGSPTMPQGHNDSVTRTELHRESRVNKTHIAAQRPIDTPPAPGHSTGADSKAHPWSSGVTAWLSHEAAGLRLHPCCCPDDGGSSSIRGGLGGDLVCATVRPLLSVVSATLPTIHGDLSISVDAADGAHLLRVPARVQLVGLSLPLSPGCTADPLESLSISLNGARVPHRDVAAVVAPAEWRRGDGLFETYLQVDTSSFMEGACTRQSCVIRIRVRCKVKAAAAAAAAAQVLSQSSLASAYGPPTWDVPLVNADTLTQGAWLGRYGSNGHLLFGLQGVNGSSNLTQTFIADVGYRAGTESNRHDFPHSLVRPDDPRYPVALQLPCAASAPHLCARGIGMLATSSIEPMIIEVALRPPLLPLLSDGRRCLNISLYFLDWDGTTDPISGAGSTARRSTAVDVFTVAPNLEIDVGHATTVVKHPHLAGGEYHLLRVIIITLRSLN
jgi:hypothetical protein